MWPLWLQKQLLTFPPLVPPVRHGWTPSYFPTVRSRGMILWASLRENTGTSILGYVLEENSQNQSSAWTSSLNTEYQKEFRALITECLNGSLALYSMQQRVKLHASLHTRIIPSRAAHFSTVTWYHMTKLGKWTTPYKTLGSKLAFPPQPMTANRNTLCTFLRAMRSKLALRNECVRVCALEGGSSTRCLYCNVNDEIVRGWSGPQSVLFDKSSD